MALAISYPNNLVRVESPTVLKFRKISLKRGRLRKGSESRQSDPGRAKKRKLSERRKRIRLGEHRVQRQPRSTARKRTGEVKFR